MPEMNVESESQGGFVGKIAEVVGGHAGARLAYGDPVERQSVTVVPVARVRFGVGGGAGRKPGGAEVAAGREGTGGGGGVMVSPTGFLIVRGDEVTYEPIRDPARMIGLVLAIGVGVWLTLRAIGSLTR